MLFSIILLLFLVFLVIYCIVAWIILYHVKTFRIQHDKVYSYFTIVFLVGSVAFVGWGALSLLRAYLSL